MIIKRRVSNRRIETQKRLRRLENADNCGELGGDGDKVVRDGFTKVGDGQNLTKIVGGTVVAENEIPWQVSLLKTDGSWSGCGAILLSCDPLIVITAAHCVDRRKAEDFMLGFGDHVLYSIPSPVDTHEVRLGVEEIIVHPDFRLLGIRPGFLRQPKLFNRLVKTFVDFNLAENDIAILKVR